MLLSREIEAGMMSTLVDLQTLCPATEKVAIRLFFTLLGPTMIFLSWGERPGNKICAIGGSISPDAVKARNAKLLDFSRSFEWR